MRTDIDVGEATPPITNNDIPVALSITRGDRLTIHYPDDMDDDIPTRDNPEVFHWGGTKRGAVALHRPSAHERAVEKDGVYSPHGTVLEGALRFNQRLHAAVRVEVDRVEVRTEL